MADQAKNNIATLELTKRELFALVAMNGITSSNIPWSSDFCAELAVEVADALIKQLKED